MSKLKLIFVDGGEASALPKILAPKSEWVTLNIPGDMSVEEAVKFVAQENLEFQDSTETNRIGTELFILGISDSSKSSNESRNARNVPFFVGAGAESEVTATTDENESSYDDDGDYDNE